MKYFYTWQEFDKDIEKIAAWAKLQNFKSVYGIPRGGLVVAVALSHHLDLPLEIETQDISQDTLVVDDISDSGNTLCVLGEKLAFKPIVAAIFYNKSTRRMPDYALREKTEWVVFPWETDVSSKYDYTFG